LGQGLSVLLHHVKCHDKHVHQLQLHTTATVLHPLQVQLRGQLQPLNSVLGCCWAWFKSCCPLTCMVASKPGGASR
jgi:hypothetical protein